MNSGKVVVLAFDGMEPKLVEEGIAQGKLPNFKKLKDTGYYSRLGTTTPPQTPVAFASFITGANPAKHGVYDFIDKIVGTYDVNLVFSQLEQKKLKGTPFWEVTRKNNIPTKVLFLPDTFPPSALNGQMISGMGVPDINGTMGTFTLVSSVPQTLSQLSRGKFVKVDNAKIIRTQIEGPKYSYLNETKVTKTPLTIERSKDGVTIQLSGKKIRLKEHEFSDWINVEFRIDFFTKISGITKLYIVENSPEFKLYIAPINFDPGNPIHPITYPASYAKDLVKKYGYFSNLGIPYDTWALEENVLDEDAFLQQAKDITDEKKKIMFGELKGFTRGLFAGYFGVTDLVQHMYWRYLSDPASPYAETIMDWYREADSIVGQTMNTLGPNDALIVLSDHGFSQYSYEINTNTWLKNHGYLTLKDGEYIGGELLEDIDWEKTKAFVTGYNSLYFNMKSREKNGIVTQSERASLEQSLIKELASFINPFTQEPVIKHVYTRQELGIVSNDLTAPDLILGFTLGARASWDTAVGAVPKEEVVTRESKWSGDHLFDATDVPGVLFSNRVLKLTNPAITDVMPAIYRLLGLSAQQSNVQGQQKKDITTPKTEDVNNLRSLHY
jgi:predicted AlkP superfamily phosphohydrolase/phosphomutase